MPTSLAAIRPLQPQLAELFHAYLERVCGMERRGEAREESFYPFFADLLEGYAESRGWRGFQALILPRKTNGCLLDLQVRRGEGIVGYVEAKPPGTDLTKIAETDQLQRYLLLGPTGATARRARGKSLLEEGSVRAVSTLIGAWPH